MLVEDKQGANSHKVADSKFYKLTCFVNCLLKMIFFAITMRHININESDVRQTERLTLTIKRENLVCT